MIKPLLIVPHLKLKQPIDEILDAIIFVEFDPLFLVERKAQGSICSRDPHFPITIDNAVPGNILLPGLPGFTEYCGHTSVRHATSARLACQYFVRRHPSGRYLERERDHALAKSRHGCFMRKWSSFCKKGHRFEFLED
jgi:hypothetical protein